jgi:hypothetical protein
VLPLFGVDADPGTPQAPAGDDLPHLLSFFRKRGPVSSLDMGKLV